jgi:hypothetical protein
MTMFTSQLEDVVAMRYDQNVQHRLLVKVQLCFGDELAVVNHSLQIIKIERQEGHIQQDWNQGSSDSTPCNWILWVQDASVQKPMQFLLLENQCHFATLFKKVTKPLVFHKRFIENCVRMIYWLFGIPMSLLCPTTTQSCSMALQPLSSTSPMSIP